MTAVSLCLHRIFIFAPAVLAFIRHRFIIVPLDPLNTMLDEKIHNLINKRGIPPYIPKMVYFVRFDDLCLMVCSPQRLYISMNIPEYRYLHCSSPQYAALKCRSLYTHTIT